MKILYYDCFSGISGDMNLGALVDLGVPAEYLLTELHKLNVEGYHIEFNRELKMGISGTKCTVHLENDHHDHDHDHVHLHQQNQAANPNASVVNFSDIQLSDSKRSQAEHHHHHEKHRNLKDIKDIILKSTLNNLVKEKSLAVFTEIAIAEAKIHGKTINDIHFHEVGAIDSIVDIVGAAICIDYLKPDRIIASKVELGGGFVKCAHGIFPVPAPATSEILKGVPVSIGKVDKETTTPTGAAILKVFVNEFIAASSFTIQKIAYGIGHRDLQIPNVLRVCIGESIADSHIQKETAVLIECNIDDMNPEHYEYLMDKLFEIGAQDVFLVPIIMKKSRPAVQLKVLCSLELQTKVENFILNETTSLGLRSQQVEKSVMQRNIRTIETKYGNIRIKEALIEGKVVKYKAEYEDCLKAANQSAISLKAVYEEVEMIMKNQK